MADINQVGSSRLLTQLNISGLQSTNNPLYQLIKNLIMTVESLTQNAIASSSSSSSSSTGLTAAEVAARVSVRV